MKNKKGEELSDIQEQILFYHASSSGHPLEKQVKNIGLAQTLQSFAHYFDTGVKGESTEAGSSLVWKTGKGKSALFRAEGDYWILMRIDFEGDSLKSGCKNYDHYLPDNFMRYLVGNSYSRFKLFHHSFFRLRVESTDMITFKNSLEAHFGSYMKVLEAACLNPSIEIINGGIQFAPFSPTYIYRKLITVCTRFGTTMPSLSSAKLLILWKDTLCWSSLDNHHDAKVIYDYLTNESSGLIDDGILNQVKEKGIPIITFRVCPKNASKKYVNLQPIEYLFRRPKKHIPFSGYLVGPNLNNYPTTIQDAQVTPKIVYLGDRLTPHVFIAYQWLDDYTFCVLSPLLDCADFSSLLWYKSLQSTISHSFQPFRDLLAEHATSLQAALQPPDISFHFLTINQTNLAIQKCMKSQTQSIVGSDLLASLSQMRLDLERPGRSAEMIREIMIEANNHGKKVWICGFSSAQRITIIVLNSKESSSNMELTLSSIQDEINFIKAAILTNQITNNYHSS